jgi:integrase
MFGERGVASISPQDIVDFVRDLEKRTFGRKKKTPKPSTIANALKPLNGTLGFAVFKGYVASNAMAQVPSGHKPSCNTSREHREWTTEEVERVIEEARKRDARGDARQSYALAIEVLLRAGLRLGEMLGLRFMDIDFEASVLLIRNSWTKAGTLGPVKTASSVRRVPVAPGLLQQLAARSLEMDADPDTFVFARKKGENPPAQSNFRQRAWLPVIEDAGLTDGPRVTPHDARHAFASQLADLDLSSSDLAPILGHSTSGITEAIYVHAFNRDAREDRVRKAMEVAAGATADQQ